MELRQLEYFTVVAEELHFGRAATRLQMTQPPLSQQILLLERELGIKLLKRSKRHVELTDAGKVFLQEVRRILTHLERAKDAALRAQMGILGRLELGFVGSATFDILPIIVRAFREQYPDVDLVLHEMPTPKQIKAFHNKSIDIGFVRTPVVDPLISHLTIQQEKCIAVMPKSHPLAERTSISMGELSTEQFILVERDIWPSWYDDILSKCYDAGFSPIIRQYVKEIQTIVGLVAAGLGVSIVPRSTANIQARDVMYVDIRGEAPQVEMSIAWRTDNNSTLIKQFLDIATRYIGCAR
ncbi:transcriptional regulator [Desulfosporosinus orientis DSM 765]|uniref:Transcriptional regulator n=1 Tax=Desulfosporosinus orientis (strain ATCC 19365 / DSM 765 / NCIMB 8382 / VKM B-1628 / Singapore I) TaxID=768706 RepID=G7W8H4_DESOD|nr:LysR family transcriptional regulator [Desulfosporosinus orientis]AET67401.1 transcriptional regulator [Desulfosporosinus orientis DSM 765]